MIIAKYIFTISVDEEWKRTIQCEMPPHNLTTREWLISIRNDLLDVYQYFQDMYCECDRLLLDLPEEEPYVLMICQTLERVKENLWEWYDVEQISKQVFRFTKKWSNSTDLPVESEKLSTEKQ